MYRIVSPLGFEFPVRQCNARRYFNEHEFVRVRIEGLHNVVSERALSAGAPITIQYGADVSSLYSFFGYVDHTEVHSVVGGDFTDVVCLGPTSVCSTKNSRTFLRRTIPGSVSDVFNEHQLGFFSDTSTQRWASLTQAPPETDWQFCTRVVKTNLGYDLIPQGAVVRCIDPVKVLSASAPLLVKTFNTFEPTNAARGSVHTDSVFARHSVTDADGRVLFADPPTILGAPDGRVPSTTIDHPVDPAPSDIAEARVMAAAFARQNVWVHQAVLNIHGDVRLLPGTTIDFQPTDRKYASYRGLWAILKVDHALIGQNGFTSTVLLGKDAYGAVAVRPAASQLPVAFGYRTVRGVPGTVWRGNQWSSAWALRSG